MRQFLYDPDQPGTIPMTLVAKFYISFRRARHYIRTNLAQNLLTTNQQTPLTDFRQFFSAEEEMHHVFADIPDTSQRTLSASHGQPSGAHYQTKRRTTQGCQTARGHRQPR